MRQRPEAILVSALRCGLEQGLRIGSCHSNLPPEWPAFGTAEFRDLQVRIGQGGLRLGNGNTRTAFGLLAIRCIDC